MSRFFLLLFLFVGCNHSILAQDNSSNLDSIIDTYRFNNQLPEAVVYLDKILSKMGKEYGNQSDTFAFYLGHKANIIKELGRYKEPPQLFKKVVTIYEQRPSKNQLKLTKALVDWAQVHINSRAHPLAQKLLDRALDIVQQTTPLDTIALARVYNNLSANYWLSNKGAKGLEFGKKALDLLSKSKLESTLDYLELVLCYENMAGSYGHMQQYEEAVAMQKKSIELRQEHFPPEKQRFASSFSNLARFYIKMNRYNEALPYSQRAAELMRKNKGNKHPETAIYLNNLANCYTHLRQFEQSEPLLLEALDIFKETLGPEHPNCIVFTNNIGGLYATMGNFEQAAIYFQNALDLGEKVFGKTHPNSITFKSSLAAVYIQSKNYEEALKLFLEAAETSKVVFGPNSLQVIISYNQMARCYLLLGPDFYPQALAYVERAMTINATEPLDMNALSNTLIDFSNRTFRSNIQFQKTLQILSRLQQAIYKDTKDQQFLLHSYNTQKVLAYFSQQLQNTVYTRQDKLRTLKQLTKVSGRAIALVDELAGAGYSSMVHEAITFAEYNKSAVLSSALQGNQAINFGEIPDSLKSLERTLKKEKDLVKKKIIQSTTKEDEEALNAATQALVEVQLEQDKLRKLLKDNYPKYNALKNEQKILTAAIIQQELLTPQSALLEYCVYDSAVYVIVITSSTVQLQKLPIEKENLRNRIKDFRKSLSNYPFIVNHEQEAYVLYTQTAFNLHEALIAPIQKHLTNIQQLIIVPDDDLGHIPFETLLSTFPNQQIINYQNLDYLLYNYTIRYSYAASLLLENEHYKNSTNNGKILGFAASYSPNDSIASHRSPANQQLRKVLDPLPAATQEIEILQEQFPNSDFFVGKEANEALFKEKAANYAILHLAMHGVVNNQYPLLSCLAFSEDYSMIENNFLEAHEISNLELSNDLVVLSACKTGYGEFEQGEGILSLARSFMYAGAPSLVVSLWEVNDLSTAAIMQLFYQNLAKGMPKDEALRQVKLEFIKQVDGSIAHPIFWSPFIVLGDNQPVHLKAPTAPWQWGAMGGGVALVGLLFLLVRKRIRRKEVV